jgi:hypothetical protein
MKSQQYMVLSCFIFTCTLLFGCAYSPGIEDKSLRDRVVACGGGFSQSTTFALGGTFDKVCLEGNISADFKEQAQALIFAEMPPRQRLAAYENYIKCIEEKWNVTKVNDLRKKVKKD